MDADIRPVTGDEVPDFLRTVEGSFGNQPSDEMVEDWRPLVELDRTLAAFDGDAIVGTAGAYTMQMTVPGGASLPVAGVSAVGVRPSHRRRGLLRAMMDRQLDDVVARGEAVAILTASESVIYGRFGYGLATSQASVAIDTSRSSFGRDLGDEGSVRLLDKASALRELPPVHERARHLQPGDITRSTEWWEVFIRDPSYEHHGMSAAFFAVHRSHTGDADGWVAYRVKRSWNDGLPANIVHVLDLAASDPVAEVALWRYLLDLDLTTEIRAWSRPVDEPLRWWLADPRRLRTTSIRDDVWVRILDVPAALSARTYQSEGELTIEVIDRFRPHITGRYRLAGGPDGATCVPTDASPDLSLTVADLGSAYLGDARFRLLGRAGRLDQHHARALRRADLMFGADVTPFCRTAF